MTDEKVQEIRAWFERHKHDYSPHDAVSPPKVWAEYFEWLLNEVVAVRAVSPPQEPRDV
jgi:hypothetical protein